MSEDDLKYFDDDGDQINPDLVAKPALCVTCRNDDLQGKDEILCNLVRADQQGEEEFHCDSYKPKIL